MPPTDDPVDNLIAEAGGLPSAQHADVPAALRLAAALTGRTPLPGQGQTRTRWAVLTRLAGHDLTLARVVEAHLDAVAILAEAGTRDLIAEGSTWGSSPRKAGRSRYGPALTADGTWTGASRGARSRDGSAMRWSAPTSVMRGGCSPSGSIIPACTRATGSGTRAASPICPADRSPSPRCPPSRWARLAGT